MGVIARRFVTESEVRAAKTLDLLTYLQMYEPDELVREGAGFHTRTHDSLKISNGKWNWFSRGIGGRSALDYLIYVRGMDFISAVQRLCDTRFRVEPVQTQATVQQSAAPQPKPFVLPARYSDDRRAIAYLQRRGIAQEVIQHCINEGIFYESDRYHNAVFVGKDENGSARYAMLRATGESTFRMEAEGSDKRYSFQLCGDDGGMLFVTESAIDALSVATLMLQAGKNWKRHHYLSLGGVSVRKNEEKLPMALAKYLAVHPEIRKVRLMLDNDAAGHRAADSILPLLGDSYDAAASFPKIGKDYNDELQTKRQNEAER